MLGWCSNCPRLVLKLCLAGAQIVPGWCSNCVRLVLELCSAGARLVLGWCSNCAFLVVPLVLVLVVLWTFPCPSFFCFSFFAIIFAVSLCFFVFFLCFFCALFVSACAGFGGWYLRVNEVLLRVRMGSGFRI